jgi:hypothetical protein
MTNTTEYLTRFLAQDDDSFCYYVTVEDAKVASILCSRKADHYEVHDLWVDEQHAHAGLDDLLHSLCHGRAKNQGWRN